MVDTKFSLMYDTFQPPQNAGFENLKQKQGKLQTCYPSAVSECCVCWVDLFTRKIQSTFMRLKNDIAVNLISLDLSPAKDPDSDKSISLFFRPSSSKTKYWHLNLLAHFRQPFRRCILTRAFIRLEIQLMTEAWVPPCRSEEPWTRFKGIERSVMISLGS